jgi:hypothetical protein
MKRLMLAAVGISVGVIGGNRRWCKGLKLQVQVAENVKAHGTVNPSRLQRAKPARIPAPYGSEL